MRRRSDLAFLACAALALWGTALWLLSRKGLDLPTKHPPDVIHLSGLALVLFAVGPGLAGITMALAARRVHRGGHLGPDQITGLETTCFFAGVGCLILGILMGPRP